MSNNNVCGKNIIAAKIQFRSGEAYYMYRGEIKETRSILCTWRPMVRMRRMYLRTGYPRANDNSMHEIMSFHPKNRCERGDPAAEF